MLAFKLSEQHSHAIRPLFDASKFMGVDPEKNYFVGNKLKFAEFYHQTFCETYLSDLKNYHAWGVENNGIITSILGFYQSIDDASWYWNSIRTYGNNKNDIQFLLDNVMTFNESCGYFKFYSMFPKKYRNLYRRLAFSQTAAERYDYFDEYYVPQRHQCKFTLSWQILYTRTLLPIDTIVRCTFLKQKYRTVDYCGGGL